MSSQYFGFDDDATASTSCIQKSSPYPMKMAPKKVISETEQLSISQIQALLCQDLTSLDGSTNISTNETSFYTDEVNFKTLIQFLVKLPSLIIKFYTFSKMPQLLKHSPKRPRKNFMETK